MEGPLVSIIISCYNIEGQFSLLLDAVKSVLNQTYTNCELIIVDDGSTDRTQAMIESNLGHLISKKKLNYERIPYNQGTSMARNRGIEVSHGEFIAFLDFDDVFLQEHLQKSIESLVFRPNSYCISLGFSLSYFLNFKKIFSLRPEKNLNNLTFQELSLYVIRNNFPAPMGSGVVYRRDIFEKYHLSFSEYLSKASVEDVHLGFKAMLSGIRPIFTNEITIIYRSYLGHSSRSRSASTRCDEFEIYDFLLRDAIIPLLFASKPNKNEFSEITKFIERQKNIAKIQSAFKNKNYSESVRCVGSKPGLAKYWFRYLLLNMAKECFPIKFLMSLFDFLKQKNNKQFHRIVDNYLDMLAVYPLDT